MTLRNLHAGEHVALRFGLSLTVPPRYDGFLGENPAGTSGRYDTVASKHLSQSSLLHSFFAESLTPAGAKELSGRSSWPLIAASADGTVRVRCIGIRLGTPKAVTVTDVVIRLPRRPVGYVSLMAIGKQASIAPRVVMAQLESMWQLFAVQGVTLPTLGR